MWHGDGSGFDQGVARWAKQRGVHVEAFPAPWDLFEEAGLKKAAAGARRREDMLLGKRGYEIVEDSTGPGIRTVEQLEGKPTFVLAGPGYKGTRRTIRDALDLGLFVERVQVEPWVVNCWHYNTAPHGSTPVFELPKPFTWIQRGKSPLANPWPRKTIPDANKNLATYERWLGEKLRRLDAPGPHWREIYKALDAITKDHVLVCSCVRDDGRVNLETGQGRCHGHSVVKAWRWWQAHRAELAPKYLGGRR